MWDKFWTFVGFLIGSGFVILCIFSFFMQDDFPSEAEKAFKQGDVVMFAGDSTKLYVVYSIGVNNIAVVEYGKPAYIGRSFNGQALNHKYFKKMEPKK